MATPQPLLIVIATFNEIENLPRLVEALNAEIPVADILVVDDSSPDGTGTWCNEFKAANKQFNVIHRHNERGLGSATITGIEWGLSQGYSNIATMDADFSHAPESLARMYELISRKKSKHGVVIGSRYVKGGSIVGWPWYRKIGSAAVNVYARFFLRLKTRDNSSAFRVYRAEALRKISLKTIQSNGYAYLEELIWRLTQARVNIAEFPIEFHDRTQGASKVQLETIIDSSWDIWKLSVRNLLEKR